MPTLTKGQTVTLQLSEGESVYVSPDVGANVQISTRGISGASLQEPTTITTSKTFGPYTESGSINIAALSGSVQYSSSAVLQAIAQLSDDVYGNIPFTYYVDSVNGNNSNTGTNSYSAFKTLSAVPALTTGQAIGLARGSVFYETLTTTAQSAAIGAYGAGPLPKIDCADVASAAGFSATLATTNVWQIQWAYPSQTVKDQISVWENGARLTRATSTANCDATAGSFYVVNPPNAAVVTVYVHASDNTSPVTNGKTYEITARTWALSGFAFVSNIRTRRNGHNDGSTILGEGGKAYGCIFEDGTVHNASSSGSTMFEACTFYKGEDYGGSGTSTMVVLYANDPRGKSGYFKNCRFIGNGTASSGKLGIYCHGQSASYYWDQLTVEGCYFWGLDTAIAGDVSRSINKHNYTTNCSYHSTAGRVSVLSQNEWIDCGNTGMTLDMQRIYNNAFTVNNATFTMTGLRAAIRKSSGAAIWPTTSASGIVASVTNSVVAFKNKSGFPHIPLRVDSGSLSLNATILYDSSSYIQTAAGVTYTGNKNVFYPSTVGAQYNGATQANFAAFQAATGQDAASVTADPAMIDPLNGVFGYDNTSSAQPIFAGVDDVARPYTAAMSTTVIAAL